MAPHRPGVRRWRGWLLRSDEQQIDEELQAHLDARVEHLVARGLSPEDARARAIERFGDLERARVTLHAQAVARRRRRDLVERARDWQRDIRYAPRSFSPGPVFTAGGVAPP